MISGSAERDKSIVTAALGVDQYHNMTV